MLLWWLGNDVQRICRRASPSDGGDGRTMSRPTAVIGVPSSAGAFAPGQEKAPQALRAAGLIDLLAGAGLTVADHGEGPIRRWQPDRENRFAQNADAVVEVARETAERVRAAVAAGQVPL